MRDQPPETSPRGAGAGNGVVAAAYQRLVLDAPRAVLVALLVIVAYFAYQAPGFRLDASADALLLENDADLQTHRLVQGRYGARELLVVTFTPNRELFSAPVLARLAKLGDRLRDVPGVAGVTSVLDVPLLANVDGGSLGDLLENMRRLRDPGVDLARARAELLDSPLFSDLLLSRDARTTALLLTLRDDDGYQALQAARNDLLVKRRTVGLDRAEEAALVEIEARYDAAGQRLGQSRHEDIVRIRELLASFAGDGELHLGGVPMISDDMISFIRSDLVTFGAGVALFLVFVLSLIFRKPRWVLLPLLSCVYSGVVMIGILGLVGWKVTVISSNFLALMLIITISMNIHLAVRYRQLGRDHPEIPHRRLVAETVRRMMWPCLYTALTTIIGFGSLVFSGIKPVIDFGWMMSIGLAVVFFTSFTLFPAVLMLLGRAEEANVGQPGFQLTETLARFTDRRGGAVIALALVAAVVGAVGASRLTVENSFVDYFGRDTEIHRGLSLIDRELGGTTPFEVLVNLDEDRIFADPNAPVERDADGNPIPPEPLYSSVEEKAAYWFTDFKVERVHAVHDFLAGLPEVGKVLSLGSVLRIGERMNGDRPLDSLQLALIYRRIPADLKAALIDPYLNIEHDEVRFFVRVHDTLPDLRRKELLERVDAGLRDDLQLTDDDYKVSGLLVLYNNMLQSLYRSQITTLGVVLIGVAGMFWLLFRSLRLAIIGVVPNVLAAALVLGLMGLAGIPLDMMTITVAAITIGIAVDNGIHYIYRFREEFAIHRRYGETLHVCHANIGKAVFYTSATVIFGFSILVLSNFLPTIYFGVLTGVAMAVALLAALTLLPKLIMLWEPFGPEDATA